MADFDAVLMNIIGMNNAQVNHLLTQGIRDAEDLLLIDDTAMTELFTRAGLITVNTMTRTRLHAFRQWVQEQENNGIELDLEEFTVDECRQQQKKLGSKTMISTKEKGMKEDAKPPEKFSGKQKAWKEWKLEFCAYLAAKRGSSDIPLSYVIRVDTDVTEEEYDNLEGTAKAIYDAPLQGKHFDRDNFQVFQYLQTLLIHGTADTYVTEFESRGEGRAAWLALLVAFEGDDARNAAIALARNTIQTSIWEKNTRNYTFDDYCTRHIKANNELTRYGVPIDGATQVHAWLAGIKKEAYRAVKADILLGPETKEDLKRAVMLMKDTLTALRLVDDDNVEPRRIGGMRQGSDSRRNGGRGWAINWRRGSPGRSGGRGRDDRGRGRFPSYRGGRQYAYQRGRGGGRHSYQDTYRAIRNQPADDGLGMSQEILNQMTSKQRAAYYQGRERMRETESPPTIAGGKRNVSSIYLDVNNSVSPQNMNPGDVTDAISSASSEFGRGQQSHRTDQTLHTKPRWQKSLLSANRRIAVTHTIDIQMPANYQARYRAELDTRADTTCAGAAFVMLEDTGRICDVNGFHNHFELLKGIPITTTATAYDHPELQETLILVFHESLYFGASMEHSLICPNQLRENQLIVDLCPKQYTEGESLHGISIPEENIIMPFTLHGCISYLPTRLPSRNELDHCRYIRMTSDSEWDPYSECFAQNERPFEGHVNRMQGALIAATSSLERRSEIDAELLAKRWGISIHNATTTLRVTTQRGVRNLTQPFVH